MDEAEKLRRLALCREKLARLCGGGIESLPATVEEAIERLEALAERLESVVPAYRKSASGTQIPPGRPPACGAPHASPDAPPADASRQLDEMKNRFLAGVSHELRTPLASIKGFAEAMLVEPDMPVEQRQKFLRIMSGEAARLAALIEDMLQATIRVRAVSGDAVEEHDAVALLDAAAENIRAARGGNVPEIKVLAAPELPPVRAWRAGALEILRCLLDNACKFGLGKPIKITAEPYGAEGVMGIRSGGGGDLLYAGSGQGPAWIKIGVHDEGPGIPPECRSRLFEKFERFDDKAHTKPGAGLGLATAKALVENEGGKIWVESAPGRGASFFFTLPAGRS